MPDFGPASELIVALVILGPLGSSGAVAGKHSIDSMNQDLGFRIGNVATRATDEIPPSLEGGAEIEG
jgi:hypothetical protein